MKTKIHVAVEYTCLIVFYFLLSLWIGNLVIQNSQYIESFEILPLREVDDYSFQQTLNLMRNYWDDNNIYDYFFSIEQGYGYGVSWWGLVHITTNLINEVSWQLASPRFLSIAFAVWGVLIIFYGIRKNSVLLALFASLFYLSSQTLIFASFRFHNHTFIFFLSVLCFYISVYKSERIFLLTAIAGFATGIKITFLPFGIFFVLKALLSRPRLSWRKYSLVAGLMTYSWLVAISPPNLFIFPAYRTVPKYFAEVFDAIHRNEGPFTTLSWSELENLFGNYYGLNSIALLALISLIICSAVFAIKKRDLDLGLGFLGSFGLFLYTMVFVSTRSHEWDAAMYALPGSLILILVIVQLYQKSEKNQKIVITLLAFVISGSALMKISQNHQFLFSFYTSEERKEKDIQKKAIVQEAKKYLKTFSGSYKVFVHYDYPVPLHHSNPNQKVTFNLKEDLEEQDICSFLISEGEVDVPGLQILNRIGNGYFGYFKEFCPDL